MKSDDGILVEATDAESRTFGGCQGLRGGGNEEMLIREHKLPVARGISSGGLLYSMVTMGFPGGSDGKESTCNAGDWVRSLGWEDLPEKGRLSTPVLWPGEFHGQRGLVGYSPWGSQKVGHD